MARTALFISFAVIGLALAGCDPAVQARHQPTSVDEIFGAFSRVGGMSSEVYELPAKPPALADGDVRPRPCRPPGLLLKPTDLVALTPSLRASHPSEPTILVAMEEPPPAAPRPGPPYRIASWNLHQEPGVKEPIASPPYAPRLLPGRSVYRNEPQKLGAYRDFERVWCDDEANLR
jgi:hypothetical protein